MARTPKRLAGNAAHRLNKRTERTARIVRGHLGDRMDGDLFEEYGDRLVREMLLNHAAKVLDIAELARDRDTLLVLCALRAVKLEGIVGILPLVRVRIAQFGRRVQLARAR